MKNLNVVRVQPDIDLVPFKTFVQEMALPRAAEYDERAEFDPNMAIQMHKLGALSCLIPKSYGGLELPLADIIWMARTFGYCSGGLGGTFIGNLLGFSAFVGFAQEELKKQIYPRILREHALWSFAMTEKVVGSDVERIRTKAIKTSKGYVLSGEKNFITNGSYSTDLSIFAHAYTESGESLGISCFYVPGNSPGLKRSQGEKKLGWRESNTAHLYIDQVTIPHTHLLGKEGDGLKILAHCLSRSKTLMGAVGIGHCDRALDLTVEFLNQTERFGNPLMARPPVRHGLTRLYMKVDAAWLLVCKAAATWDLNLNCVKESSLAKLFCGETATEVTGKCIEYCGAHGFLSDSEIQRHYRDAKAIEIIEGSNMIQEILASKFVLPAKEKDLTKKKEYKKAG